MHTDIFTIDFTNRFNNASVHQKSSFQLNIKSPLLVSCCCCNITTNMVASSNMNLLSYSSRGHKSTVGLTELISRLQQSCVPSWSLVLALSAFRCCPHCLFFTPSIFKATSALLNCSHTASDADSPMSLLNLQDSYDYIGLPR